MRRFILVLLTLAILGSLVIVATLSSGAVGPCEDWPMFHHDLALSGYTTSDAPDGNTTLWIYATGSNITSSPAIVGGKLYIGCMDGKLYALNANTGALLWTFGTNGPIYSSPAVAYDKVYFLSTDGNIYAVDANTGAFVWSTGGMGGPWSWSSPVVHDSRVFIGASNGWIHCLDAATGAIIWSTLVGGSPNSPITVANGKVFSGTHNMDNSSPTLVALGELTGAIIWTYNHTAWHQPTIGMVNSNGAAVVDGDGDGDLEVYFGIVTWQGVGNEAIALDEATGNEIWTQNLNGWSTSTPAVHDGKVFIGSDDGKLYALDAATGAYVWNYQTGGPVWAAPAVADGKVFVGSLDHTLYALDEANGTLVWSYYTGASRMMGSPAVSCGKVFIGNENGKVYAFGTTEVQIDIKPGSYPNSINLGSQGVIPVAILTDVNFDATKVDPTTVRFGPAQAKPAKYALEDVDRDGDKDMVLHFKTQDTGLSADDTQATLTGKTRDGQTFAGSDSVRIVPPNGKGK